MLTLHLQRDTSTPDGTPGRLTGMDFDFDTLEREWADNVPAISCIPAGTYQCQFSHSDHFAKIFPELEPKGMCYHVLNVPNRTGILLHNANRQEQLLGCIALGMEAGVMPDSTGKPVEAVLRSKEAIRRFHQAMMMEPFTLVIEDAKPSPEDVP